MSFLSQIPHTTLRIVARDKEGNVSYGTGFLFEFKYEGKGKVRALITNKHVVEDTSELDVHITLAGDNKAPIVGKHEKIVLEGLPNGVVRHPSSNIDLCAMPIDTVIETFLKKNKNIYLKAFDKSHLPRDEDMSLMLPFEKILMIGYPNGLWDEVNNLPLFRSGTLASIPEYDFNGQEIFVIDAACFPGSSGSPVLSAELGSTVSRDGNVKIGQLRMQLLGILYAGPVIDVEGDIITRPIPTHKQPITTSKHMINLGYVIKSKKLLDFEPIFENLLDEKIREAAS